MHFITAEEHGKISLVKDRSVCLHEGGEKDRHGEVDGERLGEGGEEGEENVEGELIRSAVWGVCGDGGGGDGVDSLRLW